MSGRAMRVVAVIALVILFAAKVLRRTRSEADTGSGRP